MNKCNFTTPLPLSVYSRLLPSHDGLGVRVGMLTDTVLPPFFHTHHSGFTLTKLSTSATRAYCIHAVLVLCISFAYMSGDERMAALQAEKVDRKQIFTDAPGVR